MISFKLSKLNKSTIANVLQKTGIFWALLLLIVILSNASSSFLTTRNILNILKQVSITSILAIGMTFVLLTGGIDLSVGSVTAFSSVFAAYVGVEERNLPLATCFAVALLVGLLCGAINGIGVAYIGLPPFIMTLGMMNFARGAAKVFTGGVPIFGLSAEFANVASGSFLSIPNLVLYMLGIFIVSFIVLRFTVYGRRIYAIGGNPDAARLSGVNVKTYTLSVYMICGALAGLCGMLMASRITSGNPTVADAYEMDAIAAAVIGGISMTGGVGNIVGTLIGSFMLIIIQNGFDILGISPFFKQIVQGAIIVLAVLLDIKSRKKSM